MKEFLLLIRLDQDCGSLSDQDMQADIQAHIEWMESLLSSGNFREANPLKEKGAILKNRRPTGSYHTVTKECFTGHYILFAESLQAATALLQGCPSFKAGASMELREIITPNE